MSRTRMLLLVFLSLLLGATTLSACKDGEQPSAATGTEASPDAPRSASTSATAPSVEGSPPPAAPQAQPSPMSAPEPTLPEPKAYATTPEEVLGTLPEGVGLAVGTSMPAFQANDAHGAVVESQTLLASSALLVVFYRGGW